MSARMSDDTPKLRMAPPESAEQLARRVERDRINSERLREQDLEQSLKPFRVGSVPYLNAVPVTRGLEDEIQFVTPAKLAEMLRRDELDAALVSVPRCCSTTATTCSTAWPSRRWAR